ncbi:MAG: pyridoxal phosphate-dependent aminotransferase [Bryobacteraceae bacterium]|nr:pyridoxal phosphate-dependent aminotransferase [Bryobacteraceae bacterium]
MAQVASSAAAVPYSRIREIAELAMSLPPDPEQPLLRLYFGESNLPTPTLIQDAARRAMAEGYTFYSENAGLPSLRAALATYYQTHHRVTLDPRTEVVITASGVQALNVAIRCVLNPGDEALILTPAWPNGSAIVEMCSARAVQVAQPLAGDRYTIDFDALEAAVTHRTRLLLYTSPSNPLGWVATEADQRRLLDFTRRHGLWLMADEVYERLNYADPLGTPVPSILRLATREDAVIAIQSFSKTYCMTGWRLGWIVARQDLAQRAAELNEFVVSHAASFTQRAAETALREGEPVVDAILRQLQTNRDYCLRELQKIPGLTVPRPEGAFYLFPRIDGLKDSFSFCRKLLEETRVGMAPGVAFGAGGEGSVRLCYASDLSILEAALGRLTRFLR